MCEWVHPELFEVTRRHPQERLRILDSGTRWGGLDGDAGRLACPAEESAFVLKALGVEGSRPEI